MPSRQEVLNVLLAQLLAKRGLVAVPEEILGGPSQSIKLPDVIVDLRGLRLIIEAEYSKAGGSKASHVKAYQKALQRIEQGVAHVGVAVVYPEELKRTPFAELLSKLEAAKLAFAIVSEVASPEGVRQIRIVGAGDRTQTFNSGSVNDLADALRRCYEELGYDESVDRAVALLQTDIESFLRALSTQPAATVRLATTIGALGKKGDPEKLSGSEQLAAKRISALIVLNALIFQEVLSQKNPSVHPLHTIRHSSGIANELVDQWSYILDKVNYMPIFLRPASC